jgi:uncharacterized protein YqeY
MIKEQIQSQLKEAMKARDSVKLETLRFLLSELKYAEIALQHELTEEEELQVLSKEVKKRTDAVQLFKDSGRDQLVTEEEAKLVFIRSFLPAQLSSQELELIVDQVIADVPDHSFGSVMKEVVARTKGRADGKTISSLVKAKLGTA